MSIDSSSVITIYKWDDDTSAWVQNVQIVPQSYKWSIQSVDYESGRVASGNMERNMVGEKRKVQITFPPLPKNSIKTILKSIGGTENSSVQVSIPDLQSDTDVYTGMFYCGDRSADAYSWGLDIWTDFSFDLIEV